jgi:hypothetical protein
MEYQTNPLRLRRDRAMECAIWDSEAVNCFSAVCDVSNFQLIIEVVSLVIHFLHRENELLFACYCNQTRFRMTWLICRRKMNVRTRKSNCLREHQCHLLKTVVHCRIESPANFAISAMQHGKRLSSGPPTPLGFVVFPISIGWCRDQSILDHRQVFGRLSRYDLNQNGIVSILPIWPQLHRYNLNLPMWSPFTHTLLIGARGSKFPSTISFFTASSQWDRGETSAVTITL